jgi:hypothetical protein
VQLPARNRPPGYHYDSQTAQGQANLKQMEEDQRKQLKAEMEALEAAAKQQQEYKVSTAPGVVDMVTALAAAQFDLR